MLDIPESSKNEFHAQKVVSNNNLSLLRCLKTWKSFDLSRVETLLTGHCYGSRDGTHIKNLIKDGENGEYVQSMSQYPNQIEAVAVHDNVLYLCTALGVFVIRHTRDCCEDVWLVDDGEKLADMVGDYLVKIRIDVSPQGTPEGRIDESSTWTFVTIQTLKDSYTFRWYGESNGYYSETVQLDDITTLVFRLQQLDEMITGGKLE